MRVPGFLLGLLLTAGLLTSGCAAGGSGGGCRATSAVAQAAITHPVKPRLKKKADRRPVCSPSTSDVWKQFKPHRGNIKTNGESGRKRRYYTWDYTHGDIEVWDGGGTTSAAWIPRQAG